MFQSLIHTNHPQIPTFKEWSVTCFQDVISSQIPDGSDEISHHQHDHSSENRTDWSCVGEPGFQTSKQTMSKVWLVGQSLVFHIFCRDLSFSYKSKLGKCASFAHQTLLRLKMIRGITAQGLMTQHLGSTMLIISLRMRDYNGAQLRLELIKLP